MNLFYFEFILCEDTLQDSQRIQAGHEQVGKESKDELDQGGQEYIHERVSQSNKRGQTNKRGKVYNSIFKFAASERIIFRVTSGSKVKVILELHKS